MLAALLFLLACPSSADSAAAEDSAEDTVPTGPGTLALSFRMDDDYLAEMDEPAIGVFRGSIYAEDDATAVGPNDNAASLMDLEVEGVDLSADGGPTAVLAVTEPIDPQIVWILGCLDTAADDCEVGDPITVPNENKLEVVAEAETPFEVYLGMLLP